MKQLVTVVTMLGLVGVTALSVAAPTAPAAAPPAAAADKDKDKKLPPPGPTTVHGANFQVKNNLDNNFCMDIAAGNTENRALSISPCTPTTTERFMFSWNETRNGNDKNDTNSIIESQGMCVDTRGKKPGDGTAVVVQKCRHDEDQRFTFTAVGLIRELRSQNCLSVSRAAAAVAVTLERCDETKKGQTWKLAQ